MITREGRRDVTLVLAGNRVVGRVRNTPVALTVLAAQILGKIGDQDVWLWLHGREAEGTIGGFPVHFALTETADGQALRQGQLPHELLDATATRIATGAHGLAWFPSCPTPLAAAGTGVYEGRCLSGRYMRIAIPERWRQVPPLPRLILLSVVLNQREPAAQSRAR